MKQHKYTNLFKAKLEDTSLVLFHKHHDWDEWREYETANHEEAQYFMIADTFDYFLCLPHHKEACLHWLNGGGIEARMIGREEWSELLKASLWGWSEQNNTMSEEWEFRIKPKTIKINGHEVPEPYRGALEDGQLYFIPSITRHFDRSHGFTWGNKDTDNRARKNGLVHLTREAAQQHAKALLSFTTVK